MTTLAGSATQPARVRLALIGAPARVDALARRLAVEPDIEVVARLAAPCLDRAAATAAAPDVALVLAPALSGAATAAVRAVAAAWPDAAPVVLVASASWTLAATALRAGARGCLLDDPAPGAIAAGVRAAARGGVPLDPGAAREMLNDYLRLLGDQDLSSPQPPGRLTPREREVLAGLADGRSNREIAAALRLHEATVRNYVSQVLAKLGVRDRTQAALAAGRGWSAARARAADADIADEK
jgi:DNA-binding NarL/FixJ family response regulator